MRQKELNNYISYSTSKQARLKKPYKTNFKAFIKTSVADPDPGL